MNQSELRVELVKLVHRHDREPSEIVARAKELEAYVLGEAGETQRPREADNPSAKGRRAGRGQEPTTSGQTILD